MERYFLNLVHHLPSLGTEVVGLAYEVSDRQKIDGLHMVSFGEDSKSVPRKFIDQRRAIRQQLSKNPDLVVSHCTPSIFPALHLTRSHLLISHFHGARYLERAAEGANWFSVFLSRIIEKKVFARTNHFITLSDYTRRILQSEYSISSDKISVIPGGVDLTRFQPHVSRRDARQRLQIDHDGPLITTVRQLIRRTGLENLIDAMKLVVNTFPDALLYIVGRGYLEAELVKRIQKTRLARNVVLKGFVDDAQLPLMYCASDMTIVPSVALEGFGLSSIESLAAGVPVLGTPVGGIPEVLAPLSASLLFEGSAPSNIAEGILQALNGQRKLPTPEVCRQYAARFSWSNIAIRINLVYKSQIEQRSL